MSTEGRPYYGWTNGQLESVERTVEIDREIRLRLEERRQELQEYKGTIADAPDAMLEVDKWVAEIDAELKSHQQSA